MTRLLNSLSNTLSNTRARGRLYAARALRPGTSPTSSRRGAFSIIGDVLGGVALFVLLFGLAILGGCA